MGRVGARATRTHGADRHNKQSHNDSPRRWPQRTIPLNRAAAVWPRAAPVPGCTPRYLTTMEQVLRQCMFNKEHVVQQGNTCSTRERVLRHSKTILLEQGRWNSMLQQVLPSERQRCNKNYPRRSTVTMLGSGTRLLLDYARETSPFLC